MASTIRQPLLADVEVAGIAHSDHSHDKHDHHHHNHQDHNHHSHSHDSHVHHEHHHEDHHHHDDDSDEANDWFFRHDSLRAMEEMVDNAFQRRNQMARNQLEVDEQDQSNRFWCMAFLTLAMMVAELTVGFLTGSLTLLSDAMHMFSDVIALLIGYLSYNFAHKDQRKKTMNGKEPVSAMGDDMHDQGNVRMEIIGALANGTVLLAFCFTLLVELVKRLIFNQYGVTNIWLVLFVGIAGFVVNVLGMVAFGGHHHHGHDHGHGHGHGHGHHHDHHGHEHHEHEHSHDHSHSHDHHSHHDHDDHDDHHHGHDDDNMNFRALFLHALADTLGSVAVIISALVIKFVPSPLAHLADPICTLVIIFLIVSSTIPLVKNSVIVLLGNSPKNMDLKTIRKKVLDLRNVANLHEMHVWQITPTKLFGSVHLIVAPSASTKEVMTLLDSVKMIFHTHGVHASVVQPEFPATTEEFENLQLEDGNAGDQDPCYDPVCEDPSCAQKQCCDSLSMSLKRQPGP